MAKICMHLRANLYILKEKTEIAGTHGNEHVQSRQIADSDATALRWNQTQAEIPNEEDQPAARGGGAK